MDEIRMRRRKMGKLCWLATVSRQDIRACLAQLAAKVNSLQGSDVYRINDLIRTAEGWVSQTTLKKKYDPKNSHQMLL